MDRRRFATLAGGVSVSLFASTISMAAGVLDASAVGPKPPTATSYYVMTTDPRHFYTMGWNRGVADHNNGNVNSYVILDFGGQRPDDLGTIKPKTLNVYYTWATVENLAEQFAAGYYGGTGTDNVSVLSLAVGTNNSAYHVDSTGGAVFASHVNNIRNWVINSGLQSQVDVQGASDMEPGYDTYSPTAAWINGWTGAVSTLLVNFGSADGCPQTTHTNGAATTDGLKIVSGG